MEGALDGASIELRSALDAAGDARHLEVDLTAVTAIDGPSVEALLDAARGRRPAGGAVALVAPPGTPARVVLDGTGLGEAFVVLEAPAAGPPAAL